MHGIHRAKHVRMLHTETNGSIATNENAGYSSGISVGQGFEVGVDVWNHVLGHEIFPIPGGRRINVPGCAQRRVHIDCYQDKLADYSRCNCLIEEMLGVPVIEVIAITRLKRVWQKIDHWVALR